MSFSLGLFHALGKYALRQGKGQEEATRFSFGAEENPQSGLGQWDVLEDKRDLTVRRIDGYYIPNLRYLAPAAAT